MQRRVESEKKKKQEKEQARLDRERKIQEEKELRQREKAEKELQRKREREEKDEQRKKEKEMREQKLLEEKMEKLREKEREKELKEQQRKIEREEKEEQRKREREEKELQKKKEREDKEREREEERKKKEEEKRQKIEAEQNKNRKAAEAFVKFFVPTAKNVDNKSEANESDVNMDTDQVPQTFMSFQIKEDMKVAPATRRALNCTERSTLEQAIFSGSPPVDLLYLSQLKNNALAPRKTFRTWEDDEDDKCSDDLFIIEEDGNGVQVMEEEPKKLYRAKFFKFAENRRPPYYGTWRKKSNTVGPRKPLGLDSRLEYDVDSDDEWEEEEPGESLHGSDDEKEVESEDEYEIDNEFFVPHGHLSDEELQNEDESDFNDSENMKVKLKLAQNALEDERKKKTQKLKPRLIGLIWQNADGSKPDNCSNGVWELMNKHALLFNGPSVKVELSVNQQTENSDDENSNPNKSLGVRRLQIGEKDIPDLIRLINGNQNNSKFLVKEFAAFLAKNHQPQREYSSASIKAKIKELAIWQACPEEGRLYKKLCWYVPIQTRKRYDVNDLTFPNAWSYIIPPRRPVEIAENGIEAQVPENKDADKKMELTDIVMLSDDSNSCTFSETLTPELIKQASSKRTPYNIAKFIRPLTEDEKKKQFEPITFMNRGLSEEQVSQRQPSDTPTTSQTVEEKSNASRGTKRVSKSSTEASAPKKRIKTTLVTQFLITNLKKRKSTEINSDATDVSSTNTAGTSDGTKKKTKLNDSVIVIDE